MVFPFYEGLNEAVFSTRQAQTERENFLQRLTLQEVSLSEIKILLQKKPQD